MIDVSIGGDTFKGRNSTLLPNNGFLESYRCCTTWNHGNESNRHNGADPTLDPLDVKCNYIEMM